MAIWQLTGRLRVSESLTGRYGANVASHVRDLSGVRVVISATTTGTLWRQWCDLRTDEQGRFSTTLDKGNAKRRFRIKVFLEDSLLKVMRPRFLRVGRQDGQGESAPIDVWVDDDMRSGRQIDFQTITLNDRAANHEARNHGRRAALWYIARTVQAGLAERDTWLGFNQQLTVVFPSVLNTMSSGNRVHIAADWRAPHNPSYNITDVVHEIMHIWNYQHNHGTAANWVCGLFGTHNRQEPRNIAFHEGFAQWASYALQRLLWGRRTTTLPYSRYWAVNDSGHRIADVQEFEKNDDCVNSALRLLVYPQAENLLLGSGVTPPNADSPNLAKDEAPASPLHLAMHCPTSALDFWDVLMAFRGGQHADWPTDWQVGNPAYGLLRFFNRVSDLFPDKFPQATRDVYLGLIDPNRSDELRDHCSTMVRPLKPPHP